jgi:hypothetical protein
MDIGSPIGSVDSLKGSWNQKQARNLGKRRTCRNQGLAQLGGVGITDPAIGRTFHLRSTKRPEVCVKLGFWISEETGGVSSYKCGTDRRNTRLRDEALAQNQQQICSKWQEIRLYEGRVE